MKVRPMVETDLERLAKLVDNQTVPDLEPHLTDILLTARKLIAEIRFTKKRPRMKKETRIDLTDEQYERLRQAKDELETIPEVLGKSMAEASRQLVQMRTLFWESVRRLVDRPNDNRLRVDWVNRCVVITESEADDGE